MKDFISELAVDADLESVDDADLSAEESNSLECFYHIDCTPLYKRIECGDWYEVATFLDTGTWSTDFFPDSISPADQTRTWVTRLDSDDNDPQNCPDDPKILWSQLPLHLALLVDAPVGIIRRLVNLYPFGVRCADDQDMLPLHLALCYGASEKVLQLLMEAFPAAVDVTGKNGFSLIDCALNSGLDLTQLRNLIKLITRRLEESKEKREEFQAMKLLMQVEKQLEMSEMKDIIKAEHESTSSEHKNEHENVVACTEKLKTSHQSFEQTESSVFNDLGSSATKLDGMAHNLQEEEIVVDLREEIEMLATGELDYDAVLHVDLQPVECTETRTCDTSDKMNVVLNKPRRHRICDNMVKALNNCQKKCFRVTGLIFIKKKTKKDFAERMEKVNLWSKGNSLKSISDPVHSKPSQIVQLIESCTKETDNSKNLLESNERIRKLEEPENLVETETSPPLRRYNAISFMVLNKCYNKFSQKLRGKKTPTEVSKPSQKTIDASEITAWITELRRCCDGMLAAKLERVASEFEETTFQALVDADCLMNVAIMLQAVKTKLRKIEAVDIARREVNLLHTDLTTLISQEQGETNDRFVTMREVVATMLQSKLEAMSYEQLIKFIQDIRSLKLAPVHNCDVELTLQQIYDIKKGLETSLVNNVPEVRFAPESNEFEGISKLAGIGGTHQTNQATIELATKDTLRYKPPDTPSSLSILSGHQRAVIDYNSTFMSKNIAKLFGFLRKGKQQKMRYDKSTMLSQPTDCVTVTSDSSPMDCHDSVTTAHTETESPAVEPSPTFSASLSKLNMMFPRGGLAMYEVDECDLSDSECSDLSDADSVRDGAFSQIIQEVIEYFTSVPSEDDDDDVSYNKWPQKTELLN